MVDDAEAQASFELHFHLQLFIAGLLRIGGGRDRIFIRMTMRGFVEKISNLKYPRWAVHDGLNTQATGTGSKPLPVYRLFRRDSTGQSVVCHRLSWAQNNVIPYSPEHVYRKISKAMHKLSYDFHELTAFE